MLSVGISPSSLWFRSRQTPGKMAQRFHTVMKHASDDHSITPIIEVPAEVVDNMRGRPTAARGELDMKGPEALCEVIPLTRPRTFWVLGNHSDRPVDKRAVPPA